MRHRQTLDHVGGVIDFRTRGFQKFETCRRRIEQVLDLDTGPLAESGRAYIAFSPSIDIDTRCLIGIFCP